MAFHVFLFLLLSFLMLSLARLCHLYVFHHGLPLSWLLGASVQEVGLVCAMKQTSLPKHGRRGYNQHGSFCSYSLATRQF